MSTTLELALSSEGAAALCGPPRALTLLPGVDAASAAALALALGRVGLACEMGGRSEVGGLHSAGAHVGAASSSSAGALRQQVTLRSHLSDGGARELMSAALRALGGSPSGVDAGAGGSGPAGASGAAATKPGVTAPAAHSRADVLALALHTQLSAALLAAGWEARPLSLRARSQSAHRTTA